MAWFVDTMASVPSVANGVTTVLNLNPITPRQGDSPLIIEVKVAGAGAAGTLTYQDSSDGFTTTNSKKTASVSGAGTYTITLLANLTADQTYYPLRNSGRIQFAATGDTTITEVRVLVER